MKRNSLVNFERYMDTKESLQIGMRERCANLTTIWFSIGIYYNDNKYSLKDSIPIVVKDPGGYYLQKMMAYLSRENILMSEFMSLIVKLHRRDRKKIRNAKRHKCPICILTELSMEFLEVERIREMYETLDDLPGVILEGKIYPITPDKVNMIY